ncbi:MAG: UDP-3-O-(3-hydroxymyristoyl)glucosamine N-acyltransferase [Planctomycetes bacterium]|nr:UDP-3-O-(3-hydroxymyristoyl)glucosamine N-acyltransferase [Planctomycetota bacterium]
MKLTKLCSIFNQNGLSASVEGDDRVVHAVNTLQDACEGEISFLSNPKYVQAATETKASAVIVKEGINLPTDMSVIRCSDPYAGVAVAIIKLHGHRKHPAWGRNENAQIDPRAQIGADPSIAPGATLAADVSIGDRCVIYPGCFIGQGATLGHDCVLFPNVVIYDHSVLGNRVTIHSGSVVGQDGLGYAPVDKKWIKIPQVGRAVIDDDVEIGANCAIDRATLGETRIGAGTKFGNLIVIGHGATVGPDCMFVGFVGIAGSASVGKHVTLAGRAGVTGHVSVGDDVTAGTQTTIASDIEAGSTVMGFPAGPASQWRRTVVALPKLPEMLKQVKDLQRQLRELRERLDATE